MGSLLQLDKRAFHKGKRLVNELLNSYPKIRECNICGWQGRRFGSDGWHPYTICPSCRSEVRHRLLAAALSHGGDLFDENILRGRDVLHFAPEAAVRDVLQKYADRYVTADFLRKDVDLNLDITGMSSVKSNEFDLVIACDVLEHVADDIKAMQEILRVLRVGGYAILTVPQKDNLEETFEDKTVVNPAERERIFGQWDHLRIYGNSFPRILESVGFKVTVINEANFSDEVVKRHVLFPPVLSKHPLATNYRKVFFAQKKRS